MRYLTLLMFTLVSVAQAATVAIMPVEAPDRQADGQRLHTALRDALADLGLTDKGKVTLNLPEARISFSCFEETPDCMAQVGQILEADELVWAKLEAKGPEVLLTLKWLDVGASRMKRSETITIPDGVDVTRFVASAGQAFMANEAMPQPVSAKVELTLVSNPPGASIWIDDARMGETPKTLQLVRGAYRLELRLDGHQTVSQSLDVGSTEPRLSFDLLPSQAVGGGGTVEPAGKSNWKLWTGAGVLVGAVALTVLSAGYASDANDKGKAASALCDQFGRNGCDLDGQPFTDAQALVDEGDSLKTKHILTGVTAGVLAGAGTWLLISHFTSDDAEPGVTLTPTLGGAALGGRF